MRASETSLLLQFRVKCEAFRCFGEKQIYGHSHSIVIFGHYEQGLRIFCSEILLEIVKTYLVKLHFVLFETCYFANQIVEAQSPSRLQLTVPG